MKLRLLALFIALAGIAGSAGCNRETNVKFAGRKLSVPHTHKGTMPIKVVCTTGMIADVVRNIGGDLLNVDQLMGEDVDPHLYKATSADVAKLNEAHVIFYSGLHLEGKMTEVLERMARKQAVFAATEYLPSTSILCDSHKHPDPHLWFDVSVWRDVAGIIGDALAMYDPANAESYKKNAEKYRAELAKLHEEAKSAVAGIPKEKRVLVTSHDAFRYFGKAYDIEVKAIQGISTDTEASLREVNELVDFIVTRKVRAVFVETSVNQRNMKSLLDGCKARGHEVVLGGELYSDAMGKSGTTEGTYAGMIRHNVDTIVKALK